MRLPWFARFWSNFTEVRFVCGLVTVVLSLLCTSPPPPQLHGKLASEKHEDRNINLYKDTVSSLMSILYLRVISQARLMDSSFLWEQ